MTIFIKPALKEAIKKIVAVFIVILFCGCSDKRIKNTLASVSGQELSNNFKNPPQNVKPWIYWYWINNHISKEGITKDLESMSQIGIGTAFIGNIYLNNISEEGKVSMLSKEWKELTQHAIREGGRLGVDIGLFNSPGWSQSGGPWNDSSNTMRYLASSEIHVSGPKKLSQKLAVPTKNFKDVVVLAFPSTLKDYNDIVNFKISGKGLIKPNLLIDNDTSTAVTFPETKELEIWLESKTPVTVSSLKLYPSKSTFVMDCKLLAETDGKWKEIRNFKFDRRNDLNQVGFLKYPPVVVSFSEVRAKKFKLKFTNITPTRNAKSIGLSEIDLSPSPCLEYYVEKSLGKMHQTPLPLGDSYSWPVQSEPRDSRGVIDYDKIFDLSNKLLQDGTLNWEVPEGQWCIQRIGMAPTGVENHPASPNATGLEVDKINSKALQQHFQGFIGQILSSMPSDERKAFKYVVADSYETGGQNWTDSLEIPFKEKYGYNPKPWLPVLTGRIVRSVEESNRFLWDLRRLIADRVAYEYVGGMRELCEKNGLQLWLENYGHWGFPSEFLMYGGQSNFIGGEFWAEGDLGSIECRAASSAAHIYGMKQVFAESFTAAGKPYLRYPGVLKKRGDWSFTEGINQVLLHVYIHQPYEGMFPGVNAPFGTEFNRNNTWFDQSKSWIDYERRCQYMLQKGLYVADVAYFIGEDVPKMTGVIDPKLPEGYSYDYINAEVIEQRLSVVDGRLTLPDAMSYGILVLPDLETMRPEVLEKIKYLVAKGGIVMGNPPTKSPSLENYPEADEKIQELSKELWGESFDGSKNTVDYGKGKVFRKMELSKVLDMLGIKPDVKIEKNIPIRWIHRSFEGKEIYFLTNQSDETITFDISFRVKGMQPEFWDATTGSSRSLLSFLEEGDFTKVPIKFAPQESGFLVFSNSSSNNQIDDVEKNFPDGKEIMQIEGDWEIRFNNPKLDLDKTVKIKDLKDWTSFEDDEIKYYSGTATYKKKFIVNNLPNHHKIFMDFGKAYVIAKVSLNGKEVGGLWTNPWRLDVTDFLKKGENQLEIKVTNLWVNQLIKDSKLPKNERKTWTLIPTYQKDSSLQPSGLMGPVKLVAIDGT